MYQTAWVWAGACACMGSEWSRIKVNAPHGMCARVARGSNVLQTSSHHQVSVNLDKNLANRNRMPILNNGRLQPHHHSCGCVRYEGQAVLFSHTVHTSRQSRVHSLTVGGVSMKVVFAAEKPQHRRGHCSSAGVCLGGTCSRCKLGWWRRVTIHRCAVRAAPANAARPGLRTGVPYAQLQACRSRAAVRECMWISLKFDGAQLNLPRLNQQSG